MKKPILIITILAISSQLYSQVNMKNIDHVPMMANTIQINDITNPSAMGGDDVLWYEDFANDTIPNVTTEDIAGYGGWHWGINSPGIIFMSPPPSGHSIGYMI